MSAAVERALAELRAVPMREAAPVEESHVCSHGCSGDQNGYAWHQRTGNLPACASALLAWRIYYREYYRARAARRRAGVAA